MQDDDDSLFPKKKHTAAKLAVLTTLVAGGLGYLAWWQHGELRASESLSEQRSHEAAACKIERDRLTAARTSLTKELEDTARAKGDLEKDSAAARQSLTAASGELQATRKELEDLRKQRAEIDKRLAAFRELTSKFQKLIDTGKLQVVVRDGRMVVKLPAGILFESGKAELSREGEMAIMEVAVILKQFPDRKFMVEGHTDSIPLKNSVYASNWQLSTSRAVKVTEFLIGAGMKPGHLVAAGRGEFDPVRSNKTEADRKENRRIEIVLMPDLAELPPMPEELLADGEKAAAKP
jgi:chemotaxis protein MotB